MRLIDADALMERADEVTFMGFQAVERKKHFMDLVSAMVESCTTIDAVHVVRCKDCKWCIEKDELTKSGHCDCIHRDVFVESHNGFEAVSFDDFCSYGERKEG